MSKKEDESMIKTDLTGQRFGKLTVIKFVGRNKYGNSLWECRCDCGGIKTANASNLRDGCTKSCGCIRKPEDLTGKRFGKLAVIELGNSDKWGNRQWRCLCDCGNEKMISTYSLTKGIAKSCGCLKKGKGAFNFLYSSYQIGARRRNLCWELTKEQFKELVISDCFYCGAKPNQLGVKNKNGLFIHNGIDRVDNNKGYTTINCITSCKNCNQAKSTLSQEKFAKWVTRVYEHWAKDN